MNISQTRHSLDCIFNARSVALIGASDDQKKFGFMTLRSLITAGFKGPIYPVNPKGGELMGLKVYPTLKEIPSSIDLAVIIIPAKFVPETLCDAAEKGAKGAVVLSGGFREAGRPDLENEIIKISQQKGIRILGPNIQGINYLPNNLCAMFFPVIKTKGPLAIISQSGTVTAALSEWAADEGLGISAAVNLGNQADLCESDYLDFFASDPNTRTIVMYLEGLKNARRFLQVLESACRIKPVALLKAGRTATGQRSAASHTGSLASNYGVFSGVCRQLGACVAGDLETLYDAAKGLATIRPPGGNRILSISSSGGAGTLAADQAEDHGLVMPPLPDHVVAAVKKAGPPPLATLSNPLDLVSIVAEDFRKVVLALDQFDAADTILLNFGDPIAGGVELAQELAGKIRASLAVAYFGGGDEEKKGRIALHQIGIPVFPTPERAVRGIGAATGAAEFLRRR
ncbi:MAG: CoA-binding domain protein [Deltaproteobacteria bacterium]|nr:CoA-binding domain protein [Deltaproteobacteria bacterium]